MPAYNIIPNDVLFFRDGRPMDTGGYGANWPASSIIFDALHAALHRAYNDVQLDWEHKHRSGKNGRYGGEETRVQRFGSLVTAGPFPVLKENTESAENLQWLFPSPADILTNNGDLIMPMQEPGGKSDLPVPLRCPLGSTTKPSKEGCKQWITGRSMESYLRGEKINEFSFYGNDDVFSSEWTTGIGIDPDLGTQDGERIYSAEYLRLRDGVAMGVHALMPLKNGEDGLSKLFATDCQIIVMGGQQRTCQVSRVPNRLCELLPVGPSVRGNRVKWVLLSPAIFPLIEGSSGNSIIRYHPGGWLPNWVDAETGRVLLRQGLGVKKAERKKQEPGKELDVHLVAARIPKPMVINGWSERLHLKSAENSIPNHGPKSTLMAVPAGAVYYFEGPDAGALAGLLNWHGVPGEPADRVLNRRSTLMGEKGFGIGVCGNWDWFEDSRKKRSNG